MTQFFVVDTVNSVYPLNIYQEKIGDVLSARDGFNPIFNLLIQEVLSHSSSLVNSTKFTVLAASTVKGREASNGAGGGLYWQDPTAKLNSSAAVQFIPAVLVSDMVIGLNQQWINGTSIWGFTDSVTSFTGVAADYGKLVQDTLTANGELTGTPVWVINAIVKASGSNAVKSFYHLLQQEFLEFSAAVVSAFTLKVLDAVRTSDSVERAVNKVLLIKDTFIAKGITPSRYEAAVYLQESLRVSYQLASGKGGSIAESMRIAAVYTAIFGFSGSAASTISLIDTTQPSLVFILETSDTAKIIDPAGATGGFDPTQFLGLLLKENVSFKIGYNADDGLWTGWVMNTQNAAVTNYANWSFNSFATLSHADLAASSTGLYALGGMSDNGAPIAAMATFAKSDFGDSRLKRMPYAYIGIRTTGDLYFVTETDDNVQRVYSLVATTNGPHTERIQMARGVVSRYWQFTLENVNGSDFRLDELELLPVMLSRRV